MSETAASTENQVEPGLTEIRVKGHLADRWADWFDGLTITLEENGDTLLTGQGIDQAALHSLLRASTLIPGKPTGRLSTLDPYYYRSQQGTNP